MSMNRRVDEVSTSVDVGSVAMPGTCIWRDSQYCLSYVGRLLRDDEHEMYPADIFADGDIRLV